MKERIFTTSYGLLKRLYSIADRIRCPVVLSLIFPIAFGGCVSHEAQNTKTALTFVHETYIDPISYKILVRGALEGLRTHPNELGKGSPSILEDALKGVEGLPDDDRDQTLSFFSQTAFRLHDLPHAPTDLEVDHWALFGIVSKLDDKSGFLPDFFKDQAAAIGLEMRLVNGTPTIVSTLEDSPAEHAGLQPADILLNVDGHSAKGMTLDAIVAAFRGSSGSKVSLTIRRPDTNELHVVTVIRKIVYQLELEPKVIRVGQSVLIRVDTLNFSTVPEMKRLYRRTVSDGRPVQGILLDLRFNAGGVLSAATDLASAFLPRGTAIGASIERKQAKQEFFADKEDMTHGKPMVVLVSGTTASGAELVARALQNAGRARVVGCPTAGVGMIATLMPLPTAGAIRVTSGRLVRSDHIALQSHPLQPDVAAAIGCAEKPSPRNLLVPSRSRRIVVDDDVAQAVKLLRSEDILPQPPERSQLQPD